MQLCKRKWFRKTLLKCAVVVVSGFTAAHAQDDSGFVIINQGTNGDVRTTRGPAQELTPEQIAKVREMARRSLAELEQPTVSDNTPLADPTSVLINNAYRARSKGQAFLSTQSSFTAAEQTELQAILLELSERYGLAERESVEAACATLNDPALASVPLETRAEQAWQHLHTREMQRASKADINSAFLPMVRDRLGDQALQMVLSELDKVPETRLGSTTREIAESIGTNKVEMLEANCQFIPARGW